MTAWLRTQSLRTCLGAGADLGHGVLLTGEYRVDTRAWALDYVNQALRRRNASDSAIC
jgi:hypothetical protein